jgi:DNA polymerase-3 subunit epsilon
MPMLTNLTLTRPLVILDLETTGVQVQRDRIVEISLLKLSPDGTKIQRT